jgi:hypothetical protein
MVRVRYMPRRPEDLRCLDGVAMTLMEWQTKVRPFSPEYDAILRLKADLHALAETVGGAGADRLLSG